MASRMKKIFHRKRDDDLDQSPNHGTDPRSDAAMGTSLYESAAPARLPQTGDYPIKSNDSTGVLQNARKSSFRSRRSSNSHQAALFPPPTSNQYDPSARAGQMGPVSGNNNVDSESYAPYQQRAPAPGRAQDGNTKRLSRSHLPQDFSGLSLNDGGLSTTTSTVTTTMMSNAFRGVPQNHIQQHPAQNSKSIRPVSQSNDAQQCHGDIPYKKSNEPQQSHGSRPYKQELLSNMDSNGSTLPYQSRDYEADLARNISIPRKEVSSSPAPNTRTQPRTGHSQHNSIDKPLQSAHIPSNKNYEPRSLDPASLSSQRNYDSRSMDPAPVPSGRAYEPQRGDAASHPFKKDYGSSRSESAPQPLSILNRSSPFAMGAADSRDARDIVERAKTNTYDTQVIETVAPAVVHEKVHKNVHHIREEVITREIHEHEVYHRILPVIDVEVLPPRHFLPVEGGGLVEIGANEVPGRGHNWVIAETASKIPSDREEPLVARQFTAREFPNGEGDSAKYVTPEGYEKTEQTWVHPPEMETGARDTGQSWPMVFGDEAKRGTYGYSSPTSKKRNSKVALAGQGNSAPGMEG